MTLIKKHNIQHKELPYETESDVDYATNDNYVARNTYDVRHRSTVTITPVVTSANNADLNIQIAVKEFDNISDLQDSDFHDHTETAGITQADKLTDKTVTLLPILQGITAIRYQAKSSVAGNSSEITVHYRGYA